MVGPPFSIVKASFVKRQDVSWAGKLDLAGMDIMRLSYIKFFHRNIKDTNSNIKDTQQKL